MKNNKPSLIDKGIWLRIQRGDQKAFRTLYLEKVGLVQFIGHQFNLSNAEKDDLVQETFLKLYNSIANLKNPKALDKWLITTAKNLIIDQMRKNNTAKTDSVGEQISDLAEKNPLDRTDDVLRETEIKLLQDLFLEIEKEKGGDTFVAFYRDGKSVKEIAMRNSESISSVTTRLTRMRRKLSEKIKRKLQDADQYKFLD